ncbi:MAG TPA: hypothetical protein VGM86_24975 [Thermoanaerobaculia bacterium]|jgi:hypothetical protein
MATRHITSALLLAAALLAQGAAAQTPVRPAQFVIKPNLPSQFLEGVAMDGSGNLTFVWTSIGSSVSVNTRSFSAADTPLGPATKLDESSYDAHGDAVVANQRGDLLITWTRSSASGPAEHFLRRTSPVLPTLTLPLKGAADVAVDRNGNFIVVWVASTPSGSRVFGQRYNADGTTRGPEFNAATSNTGNHISPSVAMNPKTGEFVVVWEVRAATEDGSGLGVYGQRFGFTTGRQGDEFAIFVPPVSQRPDLITPFAPQVSRTSNGRFVVVWRGVGTKGIDILAQRYNNAGDRLGAQLLIDEEYIPDSRPQVAMSPQGDFVVAWDDQGTSDAWFRLFRADGTPAGPVISQPPLGSNAFYHGTGRVTFGWTRTFVYGWTNYLDEGPNGNTISFQRYMASP